MHLSGSLRLAVMMPNPPSFCEVCDHGCGLIEDVPLPDESVDVVISNCVICLAPHKTPVIREIARVLRPGGRLAVSDVVADNGYIPSDDEVAWVECGTGALRHHEYLALLTAAGLFGASIEYTHETAPGRHGAIIRARKPSRRSTPRATEDHQEQRARRRANAPEDQR
jgi:SAM-dependent methyltransferase